MHPPVPPAPLAIRPPASGRYPWSTPGQSRASGADLTAILTALTVGLAVLAVVLTVLTGVLPPPVKAPPPTFDAPLGPRSGPALGARVDAAASVTGVRHLWRTSLPEVPARDRWQPPVWPVLVLVPFRAPDGPYSAGHRGVDLQATDVIRSAGPGVVSFSGQVAGRPVVTIAYGRLRSTVDPVLGVVPVGARVTAGQIIGVLDDAGPGGHCGRVWSCVHWGVRLDGVYIDPFTVLTWQRPVLKGSVWRGRCADMCVASQARGCAWLKLVRRRSTDTWV